MYKEPLFYSFVYVTFVIFFIQHYYFIDNYI
nr:MAG TPA: hypothetical protein [Caudoviricetes sp.]